MTSAIGSATRISRWPAHAHASTGLPDPTAPDIRRRLADYLEQHLPGGAVCEGVDRSAGGFSSETWFLNVRTAAAPGSLVLRRQATVGPLEPYDLAREVGVIEALQSSRVPVPRIRLFCTDSDVIGAPFVVMDRIEGTIPDYRTLPELPHWHDASNRSAMGRALVRTLVALHEVDWRSDPRLETLLPAHLRADTAPVIARVQAILAKLDEQVGRARIPPVLVEAAAWLRERAPHGGDRVVVHGDYRVGNLIWQQNEIVGVLDWEGAGIGDPLEDLGYACHPIMRARAPDLMAMLMPFDELRRVYEQESGRSLDLARLHYYVIYALYFHLHTFVTGIVAAVCGADLRVGLGYAKLGRVGAALARQISDYEAGRHVL